MGSNMAHIVLKRMFILLLACYLNASSSKYLLTRTNKGDFLMKTLDVQASKPIEDISHDYSLKDNYDDKDKQTNKSTTSKSERKKVEKAVEVAEQVLETLPEDLVLEMKTAAKDGNVTGELLQKVRGELSTDQKEKIKTVNGEDIENVEESEGQDYSGPSDPCANCGASCGSNCPPPPPPPAPAPAPAPAPTGGMG